MKRRKFLKSLGIGATAFFFPYSRLIGGSNLDLLARRIVQAT